MLTISKPHLPLLVTALRDAIRFNERYLDSETIRDIADYEEHLLCLENFAGWVEAEYLKLARQNPDLPEYDVLAGRIAASNTDPA
jgi:hypothetical protein